MPWLLQSFNRDFQDLMCSQSWIVDPYHCYVSGQEFQEKGFLHLKGFISMDEPWTQIFVTHHFTTEVWNGARCFDVALFLSFCLIEPLPLRILLLLLFLCIQKHAVSSASDKVWSNEEENEGGQMSKIWVYNTQQTPLGMPKKVKLSGSCFAALERHTLGQSIFQPPCVDSIYIVLVWLDWEAVTQRCTDCIGYSNYMILNCILLNM